MAGGVVAGCTGARPSPPAATTTAPGVGTVSRGPDGVQAITLQTQDDFVFTPDRFTVDPGAVRLTVTNVGRELTHNFEFTPGKGPAPITAEIPLLAPGQKETIDFTVSTPGTYAFECSFHVQLHQVGTMTVRG
jgi:plastocyanin